MRKHFINLLFFLSTATLAQDITQTGENFLTVGSKKIRFTKTEGYWFSHSKDAHVTLFLYANDGTQLQLETDGRSSPIILKRDENARFSGRQHFYVIFADGTGGAPEYDVEGAKISFLKIDNQNLQLDISGSTNGNDGPAQLNGKIRLSKKSVPEKIATQNLPGKLCDNTVYNKLYGAENRSPTECEVLFDMKVKTALQQAFAAAAENLKATGWNITNETDMNPLSDIAYGSENNFATSGSYAISFELDPSAEAYSPLLKKYEEVSAAVGKISDYTSPEAKKIMERFSATMYEVQNARAISIRVTINREKDELNLFKAEHKAFPLKGTAYSVQTSDADIGSGGGIENSRDVTCLYIGKWKPASIEKSGDGSETISLTASFDKNLQFLSVQNVVIRIECNAALASGIASRLDMQGLNTLLR